MTRELDKLIDRSGKSVRLRVDNGPEFIAQEMELWAERNGITLSFIEKGRPMQSGLIERFNRSYREDFLDADLRENLDQLRELTGEFIWSYNNERPHDSLLDMTPCEFLHGHGQLPAQYTSSRSDFPTFQQDQHHRSNQKTNFRNPRT